MNHRINISVIKRTRKRNILAKNEKGRLIWRCTNINLQCSLIPGPNWKWGNQDGGAGNIGRVFAVRNGVVEVNVYRFASLFNLLFVQFFSLSSVHHIH